MKNIILHIIGQRILADILREKKEILKMDVIFYENLDVYFKKVSGNTKNVVITHLSNFKIIEKSKPKIFDPIFYLVEKKNLNILTKFQRYELIFCPFNFKNFIEKINLLYIKSRFADNSNISLLNYSINLNTREIFNNQHKLKLTEREKDFLIFLTNSKKPQTINDILVAVWGYSQDMETHTVETHVHRLRKKFLNSFNDNNFIKNNKKGYYI